MKQSFSITLLLILLTPLIVYSQGSESEPKRPISTTTLDIDEITPQEKSNYWSILVDYTYGTFSGYGIRYAKLDNIGYYGAMGFLYYDINDDFYFEYSEEAFLSSFGIIIGSQRHVYYGLGVGFLSSLDYEETTLELESSMYINIASITILGKLNVNLEYGASIGAGVGINF